MRTDDLTLMQARIASVLTAGPLAWSTLDEMATRLGLAEQDLFDELAGLESGGWLATWEEWPRGLAITFSPWAAERLEIRIVEAGPHEEPRWADLGAIEPSPVQARRVFGRSEVLDLVVDPAPGPVELAILAEEIPAARRKRPEVEGAWPDARREAMRAEAGRKKRKKKARNRSKRACSP